MANQPWNPSAIAWSNAAECGRRNFGPIHRTPTGARTVRPVPWKPSSARSVRSVSCTPSAPRIGGALTLLDGHLRLERFPDSEWNPHHRPHRRRGA